MLSQLVIWATEQLLGKSLEAGRRGRKEEAGCGARELHVLKQRLVLGSFLGERDLSILDSLRKPAEPWLTVG